MMCLFQGDNVVSLHFCLSIAFDIVQPDQRLVSYSEDDSRHEFLASRTLLRNLSWIPCI